MGYCGYSKRTSRPVGAGKRQRTARAGKKADIAVRAIRRKMIAQGRAAELDKLVNQNELVDNRSERTKNRFSGFLRRVFARRPAGRG